MKLFSDVLRIIRGHKKFIVTSHTNPDADAAASALSVALALKKMGKSVMVVNQDPLPKWLKFLPQAKLFKQASKIKSIDYDAMIVLDCGDLARIGEVKKLLISGKLLVNIDHHVPMIVLALPIVLLRMLLPPARFYLIF